MSVPNKDGRRRILAIHTAKMPLASDVDLDEVASRTERFTGADLEDLVRRAGLFALREGGNDVSEVDMSHFSQAMNASRASVTQEMEEEYRSIEAKLKQNAMRAQSIGFITPGMLESHGDK